MPLLHRAPAGGSYAALAPYYDDFTASYNHEAFSETLIGLASRHGLRGERALDVACGTGSSCSWLIGQGWHVEACDLSDEMLAIAAQRLPPSVALTVTDMRALPPGPNVDLITCVDDAINYLRDRDELAATLSGFARRLAPQGVAVFDLNTERTYDEMFCSTWTRTGRLATYRWHGTSPAMFRSSRQAEANLTARTRDGRLVPLGTHRQRHFSRDDIERTADAAGLCCVAAYGLGSDGQPHAHVDESLHTKVAYVAVPASPQERR